VDAKNWIMKTKYILVILIALALTTACNGATSGNPIAPNIPATTTEVPSANTLVSQMPTPVDTLPPIATTTSPAEAAPSSCPGDEINPIGKSIADDYDSVTYEQVMTWFCNGAEFEDILVALETEAQTGTSADDMLKMLADGFTWDEIWQTIGLTN